MPQRTNTFQQVVKIIHDHLAGEGATVEESDMLIDAATGAEREVDVTLRSTVAGHPVVVSIEARASSRPADLTWVEGLLAKHAFLSTSRLVLVSEAGFTAQAREKAVTGKAIPLEPEDMAAGDAVHRVVN